MNAHEQLLRHSFEICGEYLGKPIARRHHHDPIRIQASQH